ncbi:hypothetical protein PMI09_00753, partial [Rhizobium sp. CF122]
MSAENPLSKQTAFGKPLKPQAAREVSALDAIVAGGRCRRQ